MGNPKQEDNGFEVVFMNVGARKKDIEERGNGSKDDSNLVPGFIIETTVYDNKCVIDGKEAYRINENGEKVEADFEIMNKANKERKLKNKEQYNGETR